MRVGIIQSNYLPWRGYLDFIASVDTFVIYDDVQFSKGDWRNRNRIKTPQGLQWLTVPVRHQRLDQRICDTEIDYARHWQQDHRRSVAGSYARAPFAADVLAMLDAAFSVRHATISELNVSLLSQICAYLGVRTPLRSSLELAVDGTRMERLLGVLKAVGATTYVSGPAGKAYLDERRFRESGIALEYKSYTYAPYAQLWGPFEGAVSVVDLIANCGPDAASRIRSLDANEVAVPALVEVAA